MTLKDWTRYKNLWWKKGEQQISIDECNNGRGVVFMELTTNTTDWEFESDLQALKYAIRYMEKH